MTKLDRTTISADLNRLLEKNNWQPVRLKANAETLGTIRLVLWKDMDGTVWLSPREGMVQGALDGEDINMLFGAHVQIVILRESLVTEEALGLVNWLFTAI